MAVFLSEGCIYFERVDQGCSARGGPKSRTDYTQLTSRLSWLLFALLNGCGERNHFTLPQPTGFTQRRRDRNIRKKTGRCNLAMVCEQQHSSTWGAAVLLSYSFEGNDVMERLL